MKHLYEDFNKGGKLYALYTGVDEYLKEAFNKANDNDWYRLAYNNDVIKSMSLVKTNTTKKVIDTINSLLYKGITFNGEENFEMETFVEEVETALQLFGEIAVKWARVKVDNKLKWVPEIYVEDTFYYDSDRFNIFNHYYPKFYIKTNDNGEEIKYKLITTVDRTKVFNELFKYQEGNAYGEQKGWVKVELTEIVETQDLVEKIDHGFETSFILKTNNKLASCITLLQAIDMVMSYHLQSARKLLPIDYIPVDKVLQAGSNKPIDQQFSAVRNNINAILGYSLISTSDEQKQFVKREQSQIDTSAFIEIKKELIKEILTNVGLSEKDYNFDNIGANSSAESIRERGELSRNTREVLLKQRKKQFEYMFEQLPVNITMEFSSETYTFNVESIFKLSQVVDKGDLSKYTFLKLSFPHWSEEEIQKELTRLNLQVGDLDLADVN